MLVTHFDFFTLLIAVLAFILARKAFNQSAMLRTRLDAIEATWTAAQISDAAGRR